jgi:hypothetical protein
MLHSILRAVSKHVSFVFLASFFLVSGHAAAQTETVLYTFCSQTNCADGAWPKGDLIIVSHSRTPTPFAGISLGDFNTEASSAKPAPK